MPYVFNPFTGNFDIVDTNTAAGSDTQVQFNDGGTLAGDTALTWNKTSDQLTISGDVNLDSGGSFSTTIQSVTPTANRTISFPDQTGTVGLVAGATGNIQYNNAGQLAGTGDFNVDLNWTDPLVVYTGLKVNVTNTASDSTSAALDVQANGASAFKVRPDGKLFSNNSNVYLFANDVSTWSVSTDANIGKPRGSIKLAGFQQPSDGKFAFTNSTNSNAAVDAALVRDSANVIKVTNGSTGTGYLKQTPVPFATINAITLSAGIRGFISDSNIAAATNFGVVVDGTNTGTGSNVVPVYYDGTDWRIG